MKLTTVFTEKCQSTSKNFKKMPYFVLHFKKKKKKVWSSCVAHPQSSPNPVLVWVVRSLKVVLSLRCLAVFGGRLEDAVLDAHQLLLGRLQELKHFLKWASCWAPSFLHADWWFTCQTLARLSCFFVVVVGIFYQTFSQPAQKQKASPVRLLLINL